MNYKTDTALIINEGLSDNYGDQIIKDSIQYILESFDYKVNFEDLTRHSTNTTSNNLNTFKKDNKKRLIPFKNILAKILWLYRNFKRLVKASANEYDIVVIGGGQLLIPNGTFPFALLMWSVLLNIKNNGKIILFGVGLQGDYKGINKLMLSYVLNSTKSIHVRDNMSIDILSNEFNRTSSLTYDVAFIYDEIYNVEKKESKSKYKYALGISSYDVFKLYNLKNKFLDRDAYYESWLIKLNSVNDLKETVLFYSTNEDRNECLLFKDYIEQKYCMDLPLLENYLKDDFLKNIEKCNIVISGRMHSLIVAIVLKKRIIPYILSDKINEFTKIYNHNISLSSIRSDIKLKLKHAISL